MGYTYTKLRSLSRNNTNGDDAERAPLGLLFQSLAGTQKTNEDFVVNKEILDKGFSLMKESSYSTGPNYYYFETGQG